MTILVHKKYGKLKRFGQYFKARTTNEKKIYLATVHEAR